jgi:hypothetical protein
MSRITPRADDIRTRREMGNEKVGPRTDHHRSFVDDNDINAAVGQDPLWKLSL